MSSSKFLERTPKAGPHVLVLIWLVLVRRPAATTINSTIPCTLRVLLYRKSGVWSLASCLCTAQVHEMYAAESGLCLGLMF